MKMTLPAILILVTLLSGFPAQAEKSPTSLSLRPRPARRNALIFTAPRPPRNLGAPGQRSDGAGSRGCTDTALSSFAEEPLTALIPLYESTSSNLVFGKTSAERPTLWVYVPYQPPNIARFVLLNPAGESIYEANVELPNAPGVMGLSLPDTIPALEPGETYRWFFNVYCQSPPPLAYVEGSIQREALPSATAAQIAQMTPREQAEFYAANGFWHDALTTAAALHQSNTEDESWPDLLRAIGLEDLAMEPIVNF
jgi:hypothetical protein